jgi:hypothetical protein
MADFTDLTTNIRVMAPLGDQMHRGIIVEPPADHPRREGMIYVEFTPPVKAMGSYTMVTHITCETDCIELGWTDE